MKKKIALVFVTVMLLLTAILTGCSSSSGISQAEYDKVNAQLTAAQSDLTQALAEKSVAEESLQKAQASAAVLEQQLADLKAQYENKNGTTAEIAARIVKTYNETHVYSAPDMFVCGDMSSEVWNMLKAAGISSVIIIGNKDAAITDILQSNHAWVLADIGDGRKLALETTAGIVILQSENPLYYQGWSFSSPTDLKNNNDWVREYNIRVGFANILVAEVNNTMTLYNNSTNEAEADKYLTLYDKLKELKDAQAAIMVQLKAQIDGLATRF